MERPILESSCRLRAQCSTGAVRDSHSGCTSTWTRGTWMMTSGFRLSLRSPGTHKWQATASRPWRWQRVGSARASACGLSSAVEGNMVKVAVVQTPPVLLDRAATIAQDARRDRRGSRRRGRADRLPGSLHPRLPDLDLAPQARRRHGARERPSCPAARRGRRHRARRSAAAPRRRRRAAGDGRRRTCTSSIRNSAAPRSSTPWW